MQCVRGRIAAGGVPATPSDRMREHVQLHPYPARNHLGIAGEGAPSMVEYQKPGHVDARLIDDVALWIKEH